MREIKIPLKDIKGNKINCKFYSIKNGKISKEEFSISKICDSNKLPIELITFRDKLEPGASEEWKIKISTQDSNAEVLTSMYDASLDLSSFIDYNCNIQVILTYIARK